MQKTASALSIIMLSLAASTTMLRAGSDAKTSLKKEPTSPKTWCSWLSEKPGTLYKNKENPYIQELQIFGRFHWQYAYLDGKGADGSGTRNFNYDTEEIRRFRIGGLLRFLNYFEANASVNLSKDLSPLNGSRDIDYVNLYSATLAMNMQKAFDLKFFDELEICIGKNKISQTAESGISSRFIKTVERSSLSNARYSRIAGKVDDFSGTNDLSNGRGDRHHSAYIGLNYYLCGNNAKIMTGIEYDDLNSGSQDVYEGTSLWAAFRMYF